MVGGKRRTKKWSFSRLWPGGKSRIIRIFECLRGEYLAGEGCTRTVRWARFLCAFPYSAPRLMSTSRLIFAQTVLFVKLRYLRY